MSSTAIIAITSHGLIIGKKIIENLGGDLYLPEELGSHMGQPVFHYKTSTRELVNKIWGQYTSIIFIMALGIVTRLIKGHIKSKHTDPAVVVIDEVGRYAISALSGHEGGANRLAEKIALICQGDFVVTTGSEATKTLIAGMGCRRGASVDILEETLLEGLKKIDRKCEEVRLIASVEDKIHEKGFYDLSERLKIPLKFIPKNLIKIIEGNFPPSELVQKTLGVHSVAEPCAILGGFRCKMILPKIKHKEATIAIAEEKLLS